MTRSRRAVGIVLATMVLTAGVLVMLAYAAHVSGSKEPPPGLIALMMVTFFVNGPVHTYLHEFGHAAVRRRRDSGIDPRC